MRTGRPAAWPFYCTGCSLLHAARCRRKDSFSHRPRPPLLALVIVFFAGCLVVQCVYVAWLVRGLRRAALAASADSSLPTLDDTATCPPVSVVVAAHDEASTIGPLLEALAAQTHPNVEVVLVDDASTDATREVLEAAADSRDRWCVVPRSGPDAPSKKRAMAAGVDAATHEILAFTDADCTPPPSWCRGIARCHERLREKGHEDAVLIGYSPFRPRGGLLGRWSRYETLQTGALTAAAAAVGHPYMAVGRNLSTSRSVYRAVHGSEAGASLLSGDDDLFVQAVARETEAAIVPLLDPATFVPTEPPATWRAWIRQKRRHASAGRAYARSASLHLALYHGTHTLLWLAPLLLGSLGVGMLALRLLLFGAVVGTATEQFDEPDLAPFFPVGELFSALYHVVLVPWALLRPPDTWQR